MKLQQSGDRLPHNMEIRVQAGGLNGITALIGGELTATVDDIRSLIKQAEAEFGSLEALPYDRIVQSVSSYQGRKNRKRRNEGST